MGMPLGKKRHKGSGVVDSMAKVADIGCPEMFVAKKGGQIAMDISKSLMKDGLKALAKQTVKAAKGEDDCCR